MTPRDLVLMTISGHIQLYWPLASFSCKEMKGKYGMSNISAFFGCSVSKKVVGLTSLTFPTSFFFLKTHPAKSTCFLLASYGD